MGGCGYTLPGTEWEWLWVELTACTRYVGDVG